MLIQDIFFSVSKYRDNNFEDENYNENMEILQNLEKFVLSGVYTTRKSSGDVLKNWKYSNNVGISEKLELTRQAVGSIKRDTSRDLENELGKDFSSIIKDFNFIEIERRLNKALNRESVDSKNIVPKPIVELAERTSEKGLERLRDLYQLKDKELVSFIGELLNEEITEDSMIFEELELLKQLNIYSIENSLESINTFVFVTLISILKGDKGNINQRNAIQEYITKDLDY